MLFRMQTPACWHGGSHVAFGSKTNPTATPLGGSERAEQSPVRVSKEARRTVELRPVKIMFDVVSSLEVETGRKEGRKDGDG